MTDTSNGDSDAVSDGTILEERVTDETSTEGTPAEASTGENTTDSIDADLYRRAKALLEPGEIQLDGAIVHTDFSSDEESLMHRATVEIGEIVAGHATDGSTYVYSGTDDPEFGLNQHQGLTIAEDAFVWECQQLFREGTYDVVFYYEASDDQSAIIEEICEAGYDVTSVEG